MAMWTHAEHDVAPDQYEPNIAIEDQAADHVLDFGLYGFRVRGVYVPVDRVAVALQIPVHGADVSAHFHDSDGELIDSFESIHHRDELITGIGDPEVSGTWQAVAPDVDQPWSFQVTLGATIPLGHTEPDPFVLGKNGQTHQHVFFGTGTVDPVLRAEGRYRADGWRARLWSSNRFSLYANEHGYTGPGVVEAGLGAISPLGLESFTFMLEAGVMHERPAQWGGERAKNSGRTEIMANTALSWRADERWLVTAMVKRPVYTEVLGGQMDIPLVTMLSLTYTRPAEASAHDQ